MKIFEVLASYMRDFDSNDDYHIVLRVQAENEEEAFELVDNYGLENMFDDVEEDYLEDTLHAVKVLSSHPITDSNYLKAFGFENPVIDINSDIKLYHYSFNDEILSEGILANIKHPDTETINSVISRNHDGECFNRDYCVFFNLDKRDIGDFIVSVNLKDLNKELLYVADQNIANDLYTKWYNGCPVEELAKKYVTSIKPLSEYTNEYANPEILYLGDVPATLLNVE